MAGTSFFIQCLISLQILIYVHSQKLNGIAPGDFRSCSKETNKEGIPLCKGIWEDCGSLFEITDVQIQTFRRPRHNKIPLFHGSRTRICITGIARNINTPVEAIQNSAHGEILTVKKEFCDIPKDGCGGMKNGCPIQSGDEFNYCSVLHVPDITVQLDVDVFWRLLQVPSVTKTCQKSFDTNKPPLICLKIPTSIKTRKFLGEIIAARNKAKLS
ncbi:uncharacterized protein [Lepeophtheirus salmonis]|uniref:uncharacterized protein n=1 Tax=Lepeophtheirus salmonis TaxID=72036 RepID=UPI001AEAAB8E|nr:uncharacterized protein LOC121129343 [Lepeophtheirus salmonis]